MWPLQVFALMIGFMLLYIFLTTDFHCTQLITYTHIYLAKSLWLKLDTKLKYLIFSPKIPC